MEVYEGTGGALSVAAVKRDVLSHIWLVGRMKSALFEANLVGMGPLNLFHFFLFPSLGGVLT